jgi:ankyrin repeat protein
MGLDLSVGDVLLADDVDSFGLMYEAGKINFDKGFHSRYWNKTLRIYDIAPYTHPIEALVLHHRSHKIIKYIFKYRLYEFFLLSKVYPWMIYLKQRYGNYRYFDRLIQVRRAQILPYVDRDEFITVADNAKTPEDMDNLKHLLTHYVNLPELMYNITPSIIKDCIKTGSFEKIRLFLEHNIDLNMFFPDFNNDELRRWYSETVDNPYIDIHPKFIKGLPLHIVCKIYNKIWNKALTRFQSNNQAYTANSQLQTCYRLIILFLQYGADPLYRDNIIIQQRRSSDCVTEIKRINMTCIDLVDHWSVRYLLLIYSSLMHAKPMAMFQPNPMSTMNLYRYEQDELLNTLNPDNLPYLNSMYKSLMTSFILMPTSSMSNFSNLTNLMMACKLGYHIILKKYINQLKIYIKHRNSYNSVLQSFSPDTIINKILSNILNQQDINGNTALHHAINHEYTNQKYDVSSWKVIHILYDEGCDMFIQNRDGITPFQLLSNKEQDDPRYASEINKLVLQILSNTDDNYLHLLPPSLHLNLYL